MFPLLGPRQQLGTLPQSTPGLISRRIREHQRSVVLVIRMSLRSKSIIGGIPIVLLCGIVVCVHNGTIALLRNSKGGVLRTHPRIQQPQEQALLGGAEAIVVCIVRRRTITVPSDRLLHRRGGGVVLAFGRRRQESRQRKLRHGPGSRLSGGPGDAPDIPAVRAGPGGVLHLGALGEHAHRGGRGGVLHLGALGEIPEVGVLPVRGPRRRLRLELLLVVVEVGPGGGGYAGGGGRGASGGGCGGGGALSLSRSPAIATVVAAVVVVVSAVVVPGLGVDPAIAAGGLAQYLLLKGEARVHVRELRRRPVVRRPPPRAVGVVGVPPPPGRGGDQGLPRHAPVVIVFSVAARLPLRFGTDEVQKFILEPALLRLLLLPTVRLLPVLADDRPPGRHQAGHHRQEAVTRGRSSPPGGEIGGVVLQLDGGVLLDGAGGVGRVHGTVVVVAVAAVVVVVQRILAVGHDRDRLPRRRARDPDRHRRRRRRQPRLPPLPLDDQARPLPGGAVLVPRRVHRIVGRRRRIGVVRVGVGVVVGAAPRGTCPRPAPDAEPAYRRQCVVYAPKEGIPPLVVLVVVDRGRRLPRRRRRSPAVGGGPGRRPGAVVGPERPVEALIVVRRLRQERAGVRPDDAPRAAAAAVPAVPAGVALIVVRRLLPPLDGVLGGGVVGVARRLPQQVGDPPGPAPAPAPLSSSSSAATAADPAPLLPPPRGDVVAVIVVGVVLIIVPPPPPPCAMSIPTDSAHRLLSPSSSSSPPLPLGGATRGGGPPPPLDLERRLLRLRRRPGDLE